MCAKEVVKKQISQTESSQKKEKSCDFFLLTAASSVNSSYKVLREHKQDLMQFHETCSALQINSCCRGETIRFALFL